MVNLKKDSHFENCIADLDAFIQELRDFKVKKLTAKKLERLISNLTIKLYCAVMKLSNAGKNFIAANFFSKFYNGA